MMFPHVTARLCPVKVWRKQPLCLSSPQSSPAKEAGVGSNREHGPTVDFLPTAGLLGRSAKLGGVFSDPSLALTFPPALTVPKKKDGKRIETFVYYLKTIEEVKKDFLKGDKNIFRFWGVPFCFIVCGTLYHYHSFYLY